MAEREEFFYGRHKHWNIFDVVLLLINVLEYCHWNGTKIVKAARILRIIRVFEFFPELRNMWFSILACVSSLGWALFLLGSSTLMFAMIFMEITLYYLQKPDDLKTISSDDFKIVLAHWNGAFDAAAALIFSITGGEDWYEMAGPFFRMGHWAGHFWGLLFMFYVVVSTFGLLNILVGIFVTKADDFSNFSQAAALTRARTKVTEVRAKANDLFDMHRKFRRANTIDYVTTEDLKKGFEDADIQAFYHHLDIDLMDPN